jgi:hypothetical protein
VLLTHTSRHACQAGFAIYKLHKGRGPLQLPFQHLTRAGVYPVKVLCNEV